MKKMAMTFIAGLFFLSILIFFPLTSHAAVYTGADLPGSGATLSITEDSSFAIQKDETFSWGGGTISVAENVTLNFANLGSLQGNGSFANSASAVINFNNSGSMNGGFGISNTGGKFNLLNLGSLDGSYDFQNEDSGQLNLTNSAEIGSSVNLNFQTYGAETNIYNGGLFSANTYIKDQFDVTNFTNGLAGTISDAYFTLVANGCMGLIHFNNSGLITETTSILDSNYGGHILFTNQGSASFDYLAMDATGASHGAASSVDVLYRDLTTEALFVHDLKQDPSFLEDGLERTFPCDEYGLVSFSHLNGAATVPEPATMLLLGLGLTGLAGARRILWKYKI